MNGSPSQEFKCHKGLRQGYPLAPFLFLVVTEGLSAFMRNSISKGLFDGYKVEYKDCVVSLL